MKSASDRALVGPACVSGSGLGRADAPNWLLASSPCRFEACVGNLVPRFGGIVDVVEEDQRRESEQCRNLGTAVGYGPLPPVSKLEFLV